MSNEYERYEDEYGIPWVRIIEGNEGLLKKIKEILNSNLTGEEYIQFNNFMDKLNNELEENPEEQQIFNDTKSSGLDADCLGEGFYPWKSFYSSGNIRNLTDIYMSWRRSGYHEKKITHEEVEVPVEDGTRYEWVRVKDDTYEKASKRIKKYLLDKHKANHEQPLHDIGHSLGLFRDYWGEYKSFSGRLKPIDVASYMTQVCTLVGEYLSNTYDAGKGGYDGHGSRGQKSYKAPKIEDYEVDWFIRDWNKDESRTIKLPTKPEEAENEEV